MLSDLFNSLNDDPEKAIILSEEIIDQAIQDEELEIKLEAQLVKNMALIRKGDYIKSRNDFPLLIKQLKDLKLVILELQALEEYAGLMLLLNDKIETLDSWVRCFLLAVEEGRSDFAIKSLCGIGKIFWNDSDYISARKYHIQAANMANLFPQEDLITFANLNLAVDYTALGEFELCSELLTQYKEIMISQPNEYWQSEFYFYLGKSQIHTGRIEQGEKNLLEAKRLAEKLSFRWLVVPILREFHYLCVLTEQVDEASKFMEEAILAAEQSGSDKYLEEVYLQASDFYENRKEFEKAFNCYEKATAHSVSIISDKPSLSSKKISKSIKKALKKVSEARLQIINANMNSEIEESKDRIKDLEHKSFYDPLTQTHNRRALEEHLDQLSQDQAAGLSVIIIDVDHFKSINDNFGHAVGDLVLSSLGKILLSSCRKETELVARYGGEEFCIIFHSPSSSAAENLAKRVQKNIWEYKWERITPGRSLTASFGVAFDVTNNGRSLLNLADQALYKAKEEGRNTIRSL